MLEVSKVAMIRNRYNQVPLDSTEHKISISHNYLNNDFSCFMTLMCCIYHAINDRMPTFKRHLNIYEHDKWHAQLS